jgi:hypothetical protein
MSGCALAQSTHLPLRTTGHEVVRARTVLQAISHHARGLTALQVPPTADSRLREEHPVDSQELRAVAPVRCAVLRPLCSKGARLGLPTFLLGSALQGATLAARRSASASSRTNRGLHVTWANDFEKDGAVPTQSLPAKAKASFTDANFPMDPEVNANTTYNIDTRLMELRA